MSQFTKTPIFVLSKTANAMKKILLLLFLLPISLFAQVTDDFSDGDFTQNPTWSGTTEQYMVNNSKQLQLKMAVLDSRGFCPFGK